MKKDQRVKERSVHALSNGVRYTCIHNLQGDIVALLDSIGALVVEFKCEAWGKSLSVMGDLKDTLGRRNPFRYRGYVCNEETNRYYLRSRYYNPTVGGDVVSATITRSCGFVTYKAIVRWEIARRSTSSSCRCYVFYRLARK